MEFYIGCKEENVVCFIVFIDCVVVEGVELVVLFELVNSGYVFVSCVEVFVLVEVLFDGFIIQVWMVVVCCNGIYVVVGIVECEGDWFYNFVVVIGLDGWLGVYCKLYLWGDEYLFFEVGDKGLFLFYICWG